MVGSNSNGAPVAPITPAMSENDRLAHEAGSHVRRTPTDSDPSADELLHRARNPRTISSIPRRQVRTAVADRVRGW